MLLLRSMTVRVRIAEEGIQNRAGWRQQATLFCLLGFSLPYCTYLLERQIPIVDRESQHLWHYHRNKLILMPMNH